MKHQKVRLSTTVCLFIVMGVVCVQPAAGGSLGELAALIDSPKAGRAIDVGENITIGSGSLVLTDASKVRELLAGSQRCGIVYTGGGSFTYTVKDRFSIPMAERNIRRASSLKSVENDGVLTTQMEIDGAVIWSWSFGGGQASSEESLPDSRDIPDWAQRILNKTYFGRPAMELITARGLGARDTTVALVHGSKEDLFLIVDPVIDKLETLYRIDKVDDTQAFNYEYHYLEELAAQPIGRRWMDRFPAPLVVVHEAIQVDNDEHDHVTVSTRSDLQATRPRVGVWRVDLIQRRVKNEKILPNTVLSVKVNGRPADFVHRDGELLVALDPPPAAGAKTVVEVVNQGRLALHPTSGNYWSLGTWAWYPQPPWNGEFATIDLELRVPDSYTPFASGNRVSLDSVDGFTTLKTSLDKPVQFPVMAAGKYHLFEDEQDGVTCRVGSYIFGDKKAAQRLMTNFFAAADFYSEVFGVSYPYRDMDVIEIDLWGFGQAPPGVIFITQEAFEPLGDYVSSFFSGGVNERFVHEVAHTWWGQIVKMDAPEEQWISESFAEYSAALCLEAMKGGGKKGAREFQALLNGWQARSRGVGDKASIYLANHLSFHNQKDREERTHLLYSKGPLVIHALRLELQKHYGNKKEGDRQFVVLLSSFVKNFQFKWATTQNLIGILNQMTGKDWQPWFDLYVYGSEMPEID